MALVRTDLIGSQSTTGIGTAGYTTGAANITAGKIVWVFAFSNSGSSISSANLTCNDSHGNSYTPRFSHDANPSSDMAFRVWNTTVEAGKDGSTTWTIDAGTDSTDQYGVYVCMYDACDVVVGTSATSTSLGTDGAASMTLATNPASASHVIAMIGVDNNTGNATQIPGSTFSEIYNPTTAPNSGFEVEVRTGSTSTTVDWVDLNDPGGPAGTITSTAGFAIEIKEAGAPTLTVADLTVPTTIDAVVLNIPNPVVRAWATATNSTDAVPAFSINLPTRVAGDLLLCFAAGDTVAAITPTGSWSELLDSAGGSNEVAIYGRIATNDANDNLSLAGANNQDMSVNVCSIRNHNVTVLATDIKIANVATGTSAAANPPSLNGGTARNWLALAVAVVDLTASGSSISGLPSGYSGGVMQKSAASTTSVALGVGEKPLAATQTEDPAAFTNTSGAWVTTTVLVPEPPAAVALTVNDLTVATTIEAPALTQHNVLTGVGNLVVATTIDHISAVRYPASISNRKWLDQHGNVFLYKGMSSWGMSQNLTNAEIDTALEALAALGFNAVLVAMCGMSFAGDWDGAHNVNGDPFWSGQEWASSLGSGWASVDHIVDKAAELDMTVALALFVSFGSTGCRSELEAATDAQVRQAGNDIATRYLNKPNIVWEMEADDNWTRSSTIGNRVDAFFHGIQDAEAGHTAKLVFTEPQQGAAGGAYALYDGDFTYMPMTTNSVYSYNNTAVENFDSIYNWAGATTLAVIDCEPVYVGNSGQYGNDGQQLRERNFATFLRGGVGINFGHESFWPFDYTGLYVTMTWAEALADTPTVETEHCWTLVELLCNDTTWHPDGGTFLTAGIGSGDTKAASGFSDTKAAVYFPNSRSPITIDTTVLTGANPVRLRWYDPSNGAFSTESASEAQQSGRTVTYKAGNNAAGDPDWVLVVDLLPPATVTGAFWGTRAA